MSQFVCITGARLQETKWFSKSCNALGGQIGHIHKRCQKKWLPVFWFGNAMKLKDAETAAIWLRQKAQPYQNTLFTLFLAYFCGCQRHYDPVYGSMT